MGVHHGAFWQREPAITARKTGYICRCGTAPHLAGIGSDMALGIAAHEFGLTRADLLSRRRTDDLVRARAFATWALRALGEPMSYPAIGMALGARDHSTVINLHQKAIWLRLTDRRFAAACRWLLCRFYQTRDCGHGS